MPTKQYNKCNKTLDKTKTKTINSCFSTLSGVCHISFRFSYFALCLNVFSIKILRGMDLFQSSKPYLSTPKTIKFLWRRWGSLLPDLRTLNPLLSLPSAPTPSNISPSPSKVISKVSEHYNNFS